MFGVPGGVVLPLYDKINKYGHKIKHYLPRNEQGGGFAADGYARVTGKTGMALGTSGPGATNLMTCIANSMMDSVPVVYVTGQVTEELLGTDAFQEIDVMGMSMPIVKHSYFVSEAKDVRRTLKEAFHIASTGRPGPVHVDFAKDAWLSKAPYDTNEEMNLPGYDPIPETAPDADIQQIDKLLEQDNVKPIIIAGHGVEISRASEELLEFAVRHNIPVVNTLLALGTFPQGHSQWCGMVGMHGDAVANFAVHNANLIISIGSRFDDRITGKMEAFIKDTKFIHIDIDPSEIGKNVPISLGLPGDAKDILTRANKILQEHKFEKWWEQIYQWKEKYGFADLKLLPQRTPHLMSQPRLIKMISDATNGEAIVASDVGRNQMWTGRFYQFKHPNSHCSSGGLGSMGYGMSSGIGAKIGKPDREVWAISGDGGFQMNIQELALVAEHNLDLKLVIMEDASLGMVRQWQNLLFNRNLSHSLLDNPDFVKVASGYGIPGCHAKNYEEAQKAIEKARNTDGPFLIVFHVDPDEHVFPMVPPNTPLGDQAFKDEDL